MATNPNGAVGTNAAYDGRTSVEAFNDALAAFSRGILSGWSCVPSTGLTVALGGSATVRDVAIAQDNTGDRTTINNISGEPILVTLDTAPSANSRIDAIVAYVTNPPEGNSSTADNPSACGLIVVKGAVAASPSAPSDSDIRSAITADGGGGPTAFYITLATVRIASGTTTITAGMITVSGASQLQAALKDSSVTAGKIASNAVTTAKISDTNVTTAKLANGAVTGVANNATAIGTAKLALDTVGTPNLRNLSVTAGKLANSAVTSAKLDWTTFPYGQNAASNYNITQSYTVKAKWTCTQAGTYAVFGYSVAQNLNDTLETALYAVIGKNGTATGQGTYGTINPGTGSWLCLPVMTVVQLAVNDVVSLMTHAGRVLPQTANNRSYVMAFRIG